MADINDYMDQMAEESMKTMKKTVPGGLVDTRDPRSYMSMDFQQGAEAFMRGAPFDPSKSEDWKDGYGFAMKSIFVRNTRHMLFGER